jgi:hypothetical protein
MKSVIEILNSAACDLRSCPQDSTGSSEPKARDWAGFFAALAAFAQALLPVILPLFTQPKDK